MQRIVIAIAIFSLILGGPIARAVDESANLNDSEIVAIRRNCVEVQKTLTRIHSSDALVRVNLGQQYEIISTKLMAPMNSRVALNRLNGVALAQTTVDFNSKLESFRSHYQQYEQVLLRSIQIKCTDQPVAFYDLLEEARMHRSAVRQAIVSLSDLTVRYGNQAAELRQSTKGTSNE